MSAVDPRYAHVVEWRRDIHAHPELQVEVDRTASLVTSKLREFGCDEVVTGIGRTRRHGRATNRGRDRGALGVKDERRYARLRPGWSHRNVAGSGSRTGSGTGVQRDSGDRIPTCRGGWGGGKAMVDDGLMDRLGIDEIYAMHTESALPIGCFATTIGPFGASVDAFRIRIDGKGAHGAEPQDGIDPLVVGANILLALQTIVSRNIHPRQSAVVTVGWLNAGRPAMSSPSLPKWAARPEPSIPLFEI